MLRQLMFVVGSDVLEHDSLYRFWSQITFKLTSNMFSIVHTVCSIDVWFKISAVSQRRATERARCRDECSHRRDCLSLATKLLWCLAPYRSTPVLVDNYPERSLHHLYQVQKVKLKVWVNSLASLAQGACDLGLSATSCRTRVWLRETTSCTAV